MKSAALFLWLSMAIASGANADVCDAPPPFDGADAQQTPTIHVIMSIITGEYFKELMLGMTKASKMFGELDGVEVKFDGASNGDDSKQAAMVAAASMDPGTVGILTVDGSAEELCAAINDTLASKEIAVVSFDMDGDACAPGHVLTSQADEDMASLVLSQAAKDLGKNLNVGYVNDLNYAPLKKRNDVWESFKMLHNWTEVFFVEDAANFSSPEALQSAVQRAVEDDGAVDFILHLGTTSP